MTRGACCILLAIAIFAPLARQIYKRNPVSNEQIASAQKDVVDPDSVCPEPGERTSYMVGCLLAFPLLLGGTYCLSRWQSSAENLPAGRRIAAIATAVAAVFVYRRWVLHGHEYLLIHAMLAGGLACLLHLGNCLPFQETRGGRIATQIVALSACLGLIVWSACTTDIFPLALNVLYRHPIAALPLVLLAWPATLWLDQDSPLARWSGRLAIGIALTAIFFTGLMGEHNTYTTTSFHFAAAFDPIAQVQLGKDVLVDYDSQYGLYPDLLAPLFGVIGLSPLKYTLLFELLTVGSFALLFWVLGQVVSRRSLAVAGMLATIYNCWMTFQYHGTAAAPKTFEPYFQYMPIRFVFPACAVALIWRYHNQRSAKCYWIAHFWLAVGVLWNLDGGLVALAAWVGALIFDALYEGSTTAAIRRIGVHLASATLALLGVVAVYATIKHAYYGVWPQFGHLFDYQRLFYVTGFYMLPMSLRGIWLLVALVYLAGLAQSVAELLARRRSAKQALVFALSVLGLGLFSYYQGRSHSLCLLVCSWPALLLLSIQWDQLLQISRRCAECRVFAAGLAAAIALFFVTSAASFASELTGLSRTAGEHVVEALQPGSIFADDIRVLREHASHDQALILSTSAPLLHLESGIPSIAPGGFVQMLWISQYDSLIKTLEQRTHAWVYIDRQLDGSFFLSNRHNEGCKKLMAAIRPHLFKIVETSRGSLYEYRSDRVASEALAGNGD